MWFCWCRVGVESEALGLVACWPAGLLAGWLGGLLGSCWLAEGLAGYWLAGWQATGTPRILR